MILSVDDIPKDLRGLKWREADAKECLRAGLTVEEAVRQSAKYSTEAWAISFEGDIVAVWGYRASSLNTEAQAWLLSTEIADRWEYRFARSSLRIVQDLLSRFVSVSVIVDLEYEKAINWLLWLGFVERDRGDLFMEMVVTRESFLWAF